MLANSSFKEFLQSLASKSPIPGGGGASSLVASVGVALGSMVGNLTVGKKKYEAYKADIERILEKSANLQSDFLTLVQKDAEVFEPLSKAYGLPKDTDNEKAHRDMIMEEALILACSVPIQIMEKCLEAIDLHEELVKIGTRLAISDVGVGVIVCQSALRGASLNVYINTKLMKNRDTAESLNIKANKMLEQGVKKAEDIFDEVLLELR